MQIVLFVLCLSATALAQSQPNSVCMQAAYVAGGGKNNLGCTANDVRIASINNIIPISGLTPCPPDSPPGCLPSCTRDSQVEFSALYEVVITASARWDIGLYVSENGLNALDDTDCIRSYLPIGVDNVGNDDGEKEGFVDVCGDISSARSQNVFVPYTFEIKCASNGGDPDLVDFAYCTSWRNSANNNKKTPPSNFCGDFPDLYPQTSAKCFCELRELFRICSSCVITAPDVTLECVDGTYGDPGSYQTQASTSGDCGPLSFEDGPWQSSNLPGTCGTFVRTWKADNGCTGQEETQDQVVTIVDTSPLDIICPSVIVCPDAEGVNSCSPTETDLDPTQQSVSLMYTTTNQCNRSFSKECTIPCEIILKKKKK